MGETNHDRLAIPGHVTLAHEVPFSLGSAIAYPSTRQIAMDGQYLSVEPRVMQVLVALAKARGEVVTRDELVERCWNGHVVGDDAINRVIWRLRQLSRQLGHGTFTVETIARVGVRMDVARGVRPRRTRLAPHGLGTFGLPSRRALITGGAAVVGLGSLGVFALGGGGRDPPDPRAKRFYDRAMQLRGQAGLNEAQQSLPFLKEATRIDPQYADAWGALAWTYRNLLDYDTGANRKWLTFAARSAAHRALELDPTSADAAATLLELQPRFQHWTQLERGYRAILSQNPTHGVSEYRLADVLAETGRWSDAIILLRGLARREAFWPNVRWRLVGALISADLIEEAEHEIESARRIWPGKFQLWQLKLRLLSVSGRDVEAVNYANDKFQAPTGADAFVECEQAIAVAHGGTIRGARENAIRRILAEVETTRFPLCSAAATCAFIGAHDLAFEMFQGYYLGRGAWRARADADPFTAPLFRFEAKLLRRDERFAELVGRIGLEDYWRKNGKQPDYRRA